MIFSDWTEAKEGELHIVFCDVGQGDAILITTPDQKQILIDAGPDKSVIDCLSRHMPLWDRTIELALMTHPHADHFVGYYYVIDGYRIDQFATEELFNDTASFERLTSLLNEQQIPQRFVVAGDKWKIGDVTLTILGPTDEYLLSKDPDRYITSSAESASLTMLVTYGDFEAFLSGDTPIYQMREMDLVDVDVMQVPHHGSTTGVDEFVLSDLAPELAVISVGAKNKYGHPKPKTLDLLQQAQISVLRTDQEGDVEVVSNGVTWHAR